MLARGAACDTCRARKVKCDALRPHCSPCLKSARGNVSLAQERCKYEGTSVAIATANRAAEMQKNGGTKRKKRQPKQGSTGGGVKEEEEGGGGGGTETTPPTTEKRKRKKKNQTTTGGEREESRDGSESLGPEERAENHESMRRNEGGRAEELSRYPSSSNSNQVPSVLMNPPTYQQDQPYRQYGRDQQQQELPNATPWQSSIRPSTDAPQSHPTSRFSLPAQNGSDRYGTDSANGVEGEKEQLAGRVAELERQLKMQADPQSASRPLGSSTPSIPPPLSNPYASVYASPATGARSPSFPYATYSSYNPPTPGYGSFGSNYSMNSPSSSSFPPNTASNPLTYSTSSSSSSNNPQYPPIQLVPPNSSSQYAPNPPLPLPLSNLHSYDTGRRRSLSTLSAIAGAVGMDDYPGQNGAGSNSPIANWSSSAHLQQHSQDGATMYGGVGSSNRFSTSSPVSSTRHLGTEPQAFALTSNHSSPGRSNWNKTMSSLRTEMTTTSEGPPSAHSGTMPSDEGGGGIGTHPLPSPPDGASSSLHSTASNTTSPSTTLPASVKTPPTSDHHPSHAPTTTDPTTTYFEPFEQFDPSGFPLLDLSYPPSLPSLSVLHHLVSTFFKRAAVPSTMLSKAKLFFTLTLSPTDSRWPDEALLHAICAYACMFVSEESLGGGEYGGLGFEAPGGDGGLRLRYWEVEGDQSARDYHYKKAKESIEQALSLTRNMNPSIRRNLFQVLQAVILVCYVAYLSAQFSDLWLLAGTATRLIAPLGLNHLEPWDFDRNKSGPPYQDWGIRVRKTERNEVLGPVKNLSEHWERSCTFWLAFAVDRFASANTDWTTSIDEKDISTHLPCIATQPMPGLSIDPLLCHVPSLYHASPSFLQDTSAPIGALGLYIKATILLGRVVNYTQRFPRYLVIPLGESCSSMKRDIKAGAEFVDLDVSISKFKASHSANFFDHAGSTIDGFLASAYVIPHVATILLHETLTDRYDRSPSSSIQRCLVASKCIINSTYVLYQSSYDLGGVDPFLPFCWSVAGRALVRDYTTRRFWGELEEAEQAKQLAEHCLSFMQHCAKSGSRIAQRLTETLKGHLESPESLLPLDAGCNVVFDLNDTATSIALGMDEAERQRELEGM
ncbi:uncharacterized protein JCM6883_004969 [Sporobolomyces salmoneus]|uniref:uncharacterized protein n=1 Tax=Sporobolomyces salmoneus TaxID=183962 RepID=UPI003174E90E